MRRSFNGLCGLIRQELACDPCNGSVYVFLNRRRTHMKLLHSRIRRFCIVLQTIRAGVFSIAHHS